MLWSAAGTRFYIGPADSGWPWDGITAAGFPSTGWQEIGEIEGIGPVGIEWRTAEVRPPCDDRVLLDSDERAPQTLQITFALDPADAGQLALIGAASGRTDHPFRLIFSAGSQARMWMGSVVSFTESAARANTVLTGLATIAVNSAVVRTTI